MPMTERTIDDTIEQQAIDGVRRTSVDNVSVETQSVDDLIKAQKHTAQATAASQNHLGLRFRTLKPGGCG